MWNFFLKIESLSKTSDSLKKSYTFHMFLTVFHCLSPFYAQERIAPIAFYKRATVLRATGVIRSCCSLQKSNHERFAPVASLAHDKRATGTIRSFFKRDLLFGSHKTSDSLEKPMSEFPILPLFMKEYFFREKKLYYL